MEDKRHERGLAGLLKNWPHMLLSENPNNASLVSSTENFTCNRHEKSLKAFIFETFHPIIRYKKTRRTLLTPVVTVGSTEEQPSNQPSFHIRILISCTI